ncbi:hypothetical protein SAMN02745150_01016 [Brevinema andersonii]|uniref:Uncharacterized protein n=2 Tax=Brevinema andersonii TaxID=34097 RepID=A0A1I1EAT4_BREAD|nr:hypothetical protein SAMN02745150_01016 [Brevinema andersonii]
MFADYYKSLEEVEQAARETEIFFSDGMTKRFSFMKALLQKMKRLTKI